MPAASDQPAEGPGGGSHRIDMKWLPIELFGEGYDASFVDAYASPHSDVVPSV